MKRVSVLLAVIFALSLFAVTSCPTSEDGGSGTNYQQSGSQGGSTNKPLTLHTDSLPSGFGEYKSINIPISEELYAYDFEAVDIDGNQMNLADFRGRYVYLDFWATWCGPCIKELPNLKNLAKKYADLQVIGISLDTSVDPGSMKEFAKNNGIEFPLVIDSYQDKQIADRYKVSSIPFSVLIDPDGKILYKALRGEEMIDVIGRAMGQ